jgi:hypothetical protein
LSVRSQVLRLEAHLSAIGVESDTYPNIDGVVDFKKQIAQFSKTFYNPKIKPGKYMLSKREIKIIDSLLKSINLHKLKKQYSVGESDQPTSTIKIVSSTDIFEIEDYGLEGEHPLKEIYKIIYKL